jgi:hypothetical protein
MPAIAGIVFAATFVAGFLIIGNALGNFGDSDATFAEYYADDHETEIIGGYLLVIAAIAFVCFVAGIAAPAVPDRTKGTTAMLAIASSAIFAALLTAAAAAAVTIPASRFFGGNIFDDDGQLVNEVAALPQLAYVLMFMPGALFASASVVFTSLLMRTGAFLRWMSWSGFAAAAVLLLAVFFMPVVALPLWVFAVSIGMLVRGTSAATAV